jgi:hypothetical protein
MIVFVEVGQNKFISTTFMHKFPNYIRFDSKNNLLYTNVKPIQTTCVDRVCNNTIYIPIFQRLGSYMNNNDSLVSLTFDMFSIVQHVDVESIKVPLKQPCYLNDVYIASCDVDIGVVEWKSH